MLNSDRQARAFAEMILIRILSRWRIALSLSLLVSSILALSNLGADHFPVSQTLLPEYVFVREWGSLGAADGQFNCLGLCRITIDSSDNVYVTDSWNNRVQKFARDGEFLNKWGSPGEGFGKLASPVGIAVDSENDIYITEPTHNLVQKFTNDGEFISPISNVPPGAASPIGDYYWPDGIAVDDGTVYVVDSLNYRIQKFTNEGQFISKWGSEGTDTLEFLDPRDIAVDSVGYLYVTDVEANEIKKFSIDSFFVKRWGTSGTNGGEFNGPWGIDVDSSGNVYVADSGNQRIQVFDTNGGFLTEINGEFSNPTDVAVGSNGDVYIMDSKDNRIQVFTQKLGGQLTESDNHSPVADAGASQTVRPGDLVTLDGTLSSDEDIDTKLTYRWTQVAGLEVALSNITSPKPTFTSPEIDSSATLTFQLVVNDGRINSVPDTVNVEVSSIGTPTQPATTSDMIYIIIGAVVAAGAGIGIFIAFKRKSSGPEPSPRPSRM